MAMMSDDVNAEISNLSENQREMVWWVIGQISEVNPDAINWDDDEIQIGWGCNDGSVGTDRRYFEIQFAPSNNKKFYVYYEYIDFEASGDEGGWQGCFSTDSPDEVKEWVNWARGLREKPE